MGKSIGMTGITVAAQCFNVLKEVAEIWRCHSKMISKFFYER